MPEPVEIARRDVEVPGGALSGFWLGRVAGERVVVALHGITSSSRAWLPVARALGDRAGLIAVDLRGRGSSSELSGPYGIDVHGRDILALLDALGLERVVLAGHSLGAYIAVRLAASHPERVHSVVLVEGGLPVPGNQEADLEAFLGPALARLKLRFADREAYRAWWQQHPALRGSDVADEDVWAYADHDLVGSAPDLRSSVIEEAVRVDAAEVAQAADAAYRLTVPALALCAPRGLVNDPNPMQPLGLVRAWAAECPSLREAVPVSDVNHYTIMLGARGAAVVADAIAAACEKRRLVIPRTGA
jgi:pimeloyl-ACP methyl ester carboxylesterase